MSYKQKSWLAVVACALATFNSGALFFGYPGLMTPYWQESLGVGTGATGLIMTFACLGVGCMTLVSGRVHPKMGTRRSFLIGSLILIVCMISANFANSMPMVYLWAFLNGAGTGFIYGPSLTTAQHWFPHRRGLATGVVNLCFGTAAAIMSPVYNLLFNRLGYEKMNYVALVMLVVLNGLALLGAELPERAKLSEAQKKQQQALMDALRQKDSARGPTLAARNYTVGEALRTRGFWAVWFAWMFVGAAGISMVSQGGNFAASIGLSSVVVITSFNLTNGIGRIVAGTLSDFVGRNATGCAAFVLGAVGYALLPFCSNPVLVAVLSAFVGFAFGTLFAISSPLVSDLFGLENYSTIFSLVFVAYGFVSGVVGPALVGQLLKRTGENYAVVFSILALFCLIGAGCILLARKNRAKAQP
ncbi:MAG: MFS transporter [Oscillospiraceae bacterium]|nr:MFS transporter [Oscillospiraceae bacterium]MCD8376787.1 MFS transporter [Oscillospiraceae bacterium]